MEFSAYLVTNTVNGKNYVGITSRLIRQRWAQHADAATRRGSPCILHRAMRKHGVEAFIIDHIACSPTWEDLCLTERQLIRQHESLAPSGYNMTTGGSRKRPRRLAKPLTPPRFAALRAILLGHKRLAEIAVHLREDTAFIHSVPSTTQSSSSASSPA